MFDVTYTYYICVNSPFFSIAIGEGKHWFFLYKSHEEIFELFDSLGVDEDYIRTFLPYNAIYEFNSFPVQCDDSELCGRFVLYYLIWRFYNLDGEYEDVINELFTVDCKENEDIVNKFIKSL